MASTNPIPAGDDERGAWLTLFAKNIAKYADKYGITDVEMAGISTGEEWFTAILVYQKEFMTFAATITAFKLGLRNGLDAGASLSPLVVPAPKLPTMPAAPGIFLLVASVVSKIKKSLNYSVVDGKNLGIEGTPIPPPDPAVLQPVLTVVPGTGGHPNIKWGKQHMSMLEIQVDRGEGKGWEPLGSSNQAHFVDMHELPASGKSAIWRYQAIFQDHGQRIGQWSAPTEALVKG